MRRTRWAWVLAIVAATFVQTQAARAQQAIGGADDATEEARLSQARASFEEGLAFVERKEWQEAALRFQEVLLIRASNVVAYNLAFALVQLGRLVEAAELLRPIARDPAAADVGGTAKRLLSEVEPKVGTVTVRLSGDTTDASVFVGGHTMALDRQGTPIEVDPGSIEVRIERDGVMVASRQVEVGGEQALQADVALEVPPRVLNAAPLAPAAPALRPGPRAAVRADASRAEPSEPITSKAWFWAAGAGVVVAATATVLLVALSGGSGGSGGSSVRDPVAGDAGTIAGKVIPIP